MNKTELIEKIAAGAELDKTKAKKALEATLDAIKNALVEGDSVQLIAAKKVAKFKAGAALADALN